MNEEIKPTTCPFCGRIPDVYIWGPSEYWTIRCSNTSCIGNALQMNRWKTREDAVTKWNTRAR